ncbi:hypothetical protein ACFVYV_43395 [Streptomyces mirabilis]|uniref:hypothetical protein n=1 Tax=Streptomyces mirabilis TaxID=68239 RepID=UPI0036DD0176
MNTPEQDSTSETDEVRQVVVHPVVWPHLERWLKGRNITLALLPLNGDDLPTYVMTPTVVKPESQR